MESIDAKDDSDAVESREALRVRCWFEYAMARWLLLVGLLALSLVVTGVVGVLLGLVFTLTALLG